MVADLISHAAKESLRAGIWQRKLVINILLALFLLYFVANFIVMGYFLDAILEKIFPDRSAVSSLNSFLLYYLAIDLVLRFFMQSLPVMKIEPYRHLPYSKARLAHFLLLRSLPSFINLLPLCILIPFFLKAVLPESGVWGATLWLISVLALILFSNFLMLLLKRKMSATELAIVAVIFMALGMLQYFDIVDIMAVSIHIFDAAAHGNPVTPIILLVLLAGTYLWNFRTMLDDFYLESARSTKSSLRSDSKLFGWIEGTGDTGYLLATELRLIWRNKRPRTVAGMSVLFLFYGLIFYTQGDYDERYTFLVFPATFITGGFLINYGQYIFSWESNYMDLLNVQNIPVRKYIGAKWRLFAVVMGITWILSLAYGLLRPYYFGLHTALFIYNLGFNAFIILTFCTYNKKRIELSKGGSFNWQGVGATQWLIGLPLLGLPILLFLPFSLFGVPEMGLWALSGIGLLSLACYPLWMSMIADNLQKRKYMMLEGFRENS